MVVRGTRKRLHRWCVLFLVSFGVLAGWNPTLAQSATDTLLFDVKEYKVSSGLSHQHVYQTFQDSRGVVWFVTANGLNVFDGQRFYLVLSWPQMKLPDEVRICLEDELGQLWILRRRDGKAGLSLVDIRMRTAQKVPAGFLPIPESDIFGLAGNAAREKFLLSESGNCYVLSGQKSWKKIKGGLRGFFFVQAAFPGDMIWLTNYDSEFRPSIFQALNSKGKIFAPISVPGVYSYQVMADDMLWVVQKEDALFLSPDGHIDRQALGTFSKHPKWPNDYGFLENGLETDTEQAWLDIEQGMLVWNIRQNKVYSLATNQGAYFVPPGSYHFFKDAQANYWISGLFGVVRLCPIPRRFRRINWINPSSNIDFFRYSTRGIAEAADGQIYFLSGKELFNWNPKTETLSPPLLYCRDISPLSTNKAASQLLFANNEVLYTYDPITRKSGELKHVQVDGNPLFMGTCWALYDEGTEIWIASDFGLNFYNKATRQVREFEEYGRFGLLFHSEVYQIYTVNKKERWLLSNTGLYVLDVFNQRITARYGAEEKGQYRLPALNFRHVFEGRNGVYWIATAEGLLQWDRAAGTSRLFTEADGLSDNNIYAVYGDDYGYLWMSSDAGIMQFDPRTYAVRAFVEDHGICNDEGNRISHLQASDGTIYFGSLNGITAFHPRDFAGDFRSAYNPKVLLMDATSIGHMNQVSSILADYFRFGKLYLKPGETALNLQIALPDYQALQRPLLRYRLEDSGKWVNASSPQIQLLGLAYGTHYVYIEYRNTLGQFVQQSLRIPVRVWAPFYLRALFLIPLLIGIGMLVTWWVVRQVQRVEMQKKLLEKEVEKRTETILNDKQLIEKQAIQLRLQQEEKNRFFANVTHEFRTPLALISGPLDALAKRLDLNYQDKQLLDIAVHNSSRLLKMVNQILSLAKVENQLLRPEYEEIELDTWIRQIVREFEVLAREKQVRLEYSGNFPPGTTMWADQDMLQTILSNLLSNALRFTSSGGLITVYVNRTPQIWTFRVTDTGAGIAPADLPLVFDRFYQTQQEAAVANGGTGIGLALSRELADLLGGELEVHSTLGKGSVFSLILPVKVKTSLPVPEPTKNRPTSLPITVPPTSAEEKASQRILLVEDDREIRMLLDYLLTPDYVLVHCENGSEALAHLEAGFWPDLILTDLMMPILDGYQLLDRIKAHPLWYAIPVVVLTARAGESDRLRALKLGVDDYLLKPFDEIMLRTIIDNLIHRNHEKLGASNIRQAAPEQQITETEVVSPTEWLDRLAAKTNAHLADPGFSVDFLAEQMLMGRTSFYKEVRKLTGLTPNQYILEARLIRARIILETEPNTSTRKLVQMVGLKDEGNFSQAFRKRFGYAPSWFNRNADKR